MSRAGKLTRCIKLITVNGSIYFVYFLRIRLDVLDTIYQETENLITFISDVIEMKTNMEIVWILLFLET